MPLDNLQAWQHQKGDQPVPPFPSTTPRLFPRQHQDFSLDNTKITDAGLVHLKGLNRLQPLYLYGSQVTDAGIAELQQALPNRKIN